jgi:capsule polysaccharide export protein KpsE/RkpR
LVERINISEDSKSGIITIAVTDPSPKRAAAMAQEYVNELNWALSNLTTSSAHRERVFLEGRLKEVKGDLEAAEQQLSGFASQKDAIDIQAQAKALVESAATLQGQLIADQSELEALREIYTDNNIRVRSMEARVAEMHRQLPRIGGKGANENSVVEQLYPSLRQLPLLGVNYADLLRRVKVQEAVLRCSRRITSWLRWTKPKKSRLFRFSTRRRFRKRNPFRRAC